MYAPPPFAGSPVRSATVSLVLRCTRCVSYRGFYGSSSGGDSANCFDSRREKSRTCVRIYWLSSWFLHAWYLQLDQDWLVFVVETPHANQWTLNSDAQSLGHNPVVISYFYLITEYNYSLGVKHLDKCRGFHHPLISLHTVPPPVAWTFGYALQLLTQAHLPSQEASAPIAAKEQMEAVANVARPEGGDTTPWSPGFLSALEDACQALGVKPPETPLVYPPPPPASESQARPVVTARGNEALVDAKGSRDTGVLPALEALLVAARNRASLGGEVAGTPAMEAKGVVLGERAVDDGDEYADSLAGFAAGVYSGDEVVDQVATVLRMLFLLDLRGVQDEVNAILAKAQVSRTRLDLK